MFAGPSSHKRRRASARGDQSRKRVPGRVTLNVAGIDVKGKSRQQTDHEARRRFASVVESHVFNHEATFLLPSSTKAERQMCAMLAQTLEQRARKLSASFYVARVSLHLFLNPDFVSQYVKTADLIALSTGHLDTDDIICLDGQGMLILNLTKDTYQVLGLTGRPSRFALGSSGRTGDRKSGPVERYIVEIPLLDSTFVPGKPGWQKVNDSFQRWTQIRRTDRPGTDGKWTIAFAASSSRQSIVFPSELVEESDIDQLSLETEQSDVQDIWLPDLAAASDTVGGDGDGLYDIGTGWKEQGESSSTATRSSWDAWSQAFADFSEWQNLVQLQAEGVKTYFSPPSLPINSYTAPTPHHAGSAIAVTFRGFLHPALIQELLDMAATSLDQFPITNIITCSVSGFAHSPIRWRSHDPGWGLAFGAGRSPADGVHPKDKTSSRGSLFATSSTHRAMHRTQHDAMDVDSDSDSDSQSDSSDSNSDDDEDEAMAHSSSLPLHKQTGRKARQKRHRLSKRKGSMRKGESERSADGGRSTNCGSAAGGEAGWGCLIFGRGGQEKTEDTTPSPARFVWWENVQGDTRS